MRCKIQPLCNGMAAKARALRVNVVNNPAKVYDVSASSVPKIKSEPGPNNEAS